MRRAWWTRTKITIAAVVLALLVLLLIVLPLIIVLCTSSSSDSTTAASSDSASQKGAVPIVRSSSHLYYYSPQLFCLHVCKAGSGCGVTPVPEFLHENGLGYCLGTPRWDLRNIGSSRASWVLDKRQRPHSLRKVIGVVFKRCGTQKASNKFQSVSTASRRRQFDKGKQ